MPDCMYVSTYVICMFSYLYAVSPTSWWQGSVYSRSPSDLEQVLLSAVDPPPVTRQAVSWTCRSPVGNIRGQPISGKINGTGERFKTC